MAHASSAKTPVTPRLYLLGAFRLEISKRPIRLTTRKVESLLAFLALSPQPHTREKLAALLWGDFTDEQARHSLRTALATLRKELRGDILLADRETIQLNPDYPLWVDAIAFQQSVTDDPQSAIGLYQGDLLTDFYDDWILQERERLRLLYIATLLRLAQQARSHSEYARAIEFAQKVLAADPADEKAYQHIIFCHAVMGDRIGALKQYDECEKKLRDELGVEPSRETVALRDRIEQELTGGKSREALFTNVPVPLTSFVGRQLAMAEVKRLLETTRLLTLTGAGGCGKTRLAIQIATDLAHANRFKNGVWWVDLAALSDPALVPQTVAGVFNLRESADEPLITVLTNYFRHKELLLVLDNCEHLIDACAQLAEALLSACPKLQILATSREAPGITGEVAWYVPSMALPDAERLPPRDSLAQYDALRLLAERARAVVAHWQLADHADAAVRICCRLDGIPLAIELAAARLRVLSAEQIAERLDDRFQLLTSGSRTALPRYRTLRATIDWSYDLLSEEERTLFRRLSVFAGGWRLDAAEMVCAGAGQDVTQSVPYNMLDALTRLVDKSLVIAETRGTEVRYRMLETICQYARERLVESGELQARRDRHLDCFLKLAESANPWVIYGDPTWLDRLETEHDNLRVALEHAVANNAELALRLATALEWFWDFRGHPQEGYAWVMRLLPLTAAWGPGKPRTGALRLAGSRADGVANHQSARTFLEAGLKMARMTDDKYQMAYALHDLAALSFHTGDLAQMRPYAEESLLLWRELGVRWGISDSLWQLGKAAYSSGNYESARLLFEQSLELARKENMPNFIAFAQSSLGELAYLTGDYAKASVSYAECVQLAREMKFKGNLASYLVKLGQVVLHEGDHARSMTLFKESLAIYRQLESVGDLTRSLAGFAEVLGVVGKHEQAARLFGAVEAAHKALGQKMRLLDRMEYDRIVAAVRAQLDEATFNAAWAEGRAMTLDQAIAYALEESSRQENVPS